MFGVAMLLIVGAGQKDKKTVTVKKYIVLQLLDEKGH